MLFRSKVLAGGQSLVPVMAFRLARPGHLVDINGIDELDYVKAEGGRLPITLAGARDPIPLADESWGCDLEGEVVVAFLQERGAAGREGGERAAASGAPGDHLGAVEAAVPGGPKRTRDRAADQAEAKDRDAESGGLRGGGHGRMLPRRTAPVAVRTSGRRPARERRRPRSPRAVVRCEGGC